MYAPVNLRGVLAEAWVLAADGVPGKFEDIKFAALPLNWVADG
jgi:hypothetical protein